jgi:hypothetical protein
MAKKIAMRLLNVNSITLTIRRHDSVALISIGLTSAGGWRNIGLGFERALLPQDWILNFIFCRFRRGQIASGCSRTNLRVCGFRFEQSLIQ